MPYLIPEIGNTTNIHGIIILENGFPKNPFILDRMGETNAVPLSSLLKSKCKELQGISRVTRFHAASWFHQSVMMSCCQ